MWTWKETVGLKEQGYEPVRWHYRPSAGIIASPIQSQFELKPI